ncbi:uncharacterized protein LOC106652634 isoform X2 [Trichogramma pretiosum]|uniref:uncharacterized protein LOC106652634 isoform X2 n=1 Tax=Trichogramma pretiosum TaxID=7493 RepID=UPI0006C93BCF|nr:uncharacterized protein LOC106652634 isoform X2 [Trichogramma pretiosum]
MDNGLQPILTTSDASIESSFLTLPGAEAIVNNNNNNNSNDSGTTMAELPQAAHLMVDRLLVTTPSWESVNQDLRWFFLLHTYTFACLFFVLSFYTFFSLLNLRSLISTPRHMSTINIFLCLLGASRSTCLFIDSYNLKEIMPRVIGAIAWDLGFPFITSAFCLIQLAFFQLTRLKFGLELFQRETYLSLVIIFHFSCVIISDVTLALNMSYVGKYMVQAVFLVWGLILYLSFLYAGYKVKSLLKTLPSNLLARDTLGSNQKGIMQLAMLAPYNNLATSVAAALVPTLLGPAKMRAALESEAAAPAATAAAATTTTTTTAATTSRTGPDANNPSLTSTQRGSGGGSGGAGGSYKSAARIQMEHERISKILSTSPGDDRQRDLQQHYHQHQQQSSSSSTVPEVYVRPPTPTPSIANLPIITVSSPSRRSSLVSRRGSDVSARTSRRASECSVRFVSEEDEIEEEKDASVSPSLDKPVEGILRRNSDCSSISAGGYSSRDARRGSDVSHGGEKCRPQFATKLRRNSDFGNRVPKRVQDQDQSKLSRILDVSPGISGQLLLLTGSRRNSDLNGLPAPRAVESRRNSDVSYRSSERRASDIGQISTRPSSRRASDFSMRQMQQIESDNEQTEADLGGCDSGEKVALVNDQGGGGGGGSDESNSNNKSRKKNLSWKCDKLKEEQEVITAETSLLTDVQQKAGLGSSGGDFTLHSILNHIAYVNRTKSGMPLHISEASTAAARRAQIKRVLNVTYTTAILGIILCLADIARIFGPYGLWADVATQDSKPAPSQLPRPWPWIIYQTVCRLTELIMGCAMASITKQPSASPRHGYLGNYPNYNLRMKQRDNLYI